MSRSHQYGPIGHGQHWNDAPPLGQIRSQSRSATPSNLVPARTSTPPPLRSGSPSVSTLAPAAAAAKAIGNDDAVRRGSTTTTGIHTSSSAHNHLADSGGSGTQRRDNDRLQQAIDAVSSSASKLPATTHRQLVDRVRKALDVSALSDEAYSDLLSALQSDDAQSGVGAEGADDDDGFEHIEMEPTYTTSPVSDTAQSRSDSGVRLRHSDPSSQTAAPADSPSASGAAAHTAAPDLSTDAARSAIAGAGACAGAGAGVGVDPVSDSRAVQLRAADEMRKGVVEFIRRHAADAAGVIRWASALRSLVENVLP